jgi:hypothetical protein
MSDDNVIEKSIDFRRGIPPSSDGGGIFNKIFPNELR